MKLATMHGRGLHPTDAILVRPSSALAFAGELRNHIAARGSLAAPSHAVRTATRAAIAE